jgi:dTDP-4-amino-4,6-dideoxygalactose transaminase
MLFSEIPRTRLYLKNSELIKTLYRLLVNKIEQGVQVDQFEKEFALWTGCKNAIAGSYARVCFYYILKKLLLIGPPGEIITTPITIHDMINMIVCAGLQPRFIDIDRSTFQMDPDLLEKTINPNTRAVLVTHLFGMPSNMEKIVSICQKHGLILIEDCSHGFGSKYKGKLCGTFGKAGFFSLSSLKSISSGYGGVIISEDDELAVSIRSDFEKLRTCTVSDIIDIIKKSLVIGAVTSPFVFTSAFAIVSKMQTDNPERKLYQSVPEKFLWQYSPLQANLATQCLRRVDEQNKKRIENALILYDMLKKDASDRIPVLLPDTCNVFWRFPFRAPEGRKFVQFMNHYGIDIAQTLLPCCTSERVFSDFHTPTPHAESAVKEIYFLPVEHWLNKKQIMHLGNTVQKFLKR